MKKPTILIIAIIAVLGLVGLVISSSKSKSPTLQGQTTTTSDNKDVAKANEIFIKNFSFNPSKLTIKKGTALTWTNKDDAHHDVSPDKDFGDAFKPSELMAKGQSYSFTFNTPGTYSYHCTPHPYMKATIEVTE